MRVVITGYGSVSPLGDSVDLLWSGLLAGESGVRSISPDSGGDTLPVKIAAPADVEVVEQLGRVTAQRLDRAQQLAVIAAAEAWADAGSPSPDPDRLAVVIGTGIGGLQTLLREDDTLESAGARRVSPRAVPMLMPNGASAQLSIEYGARAGTYTTAAACASGAEAIAAAARLIRAGEADIVIAGGTEAAIAPLTLAAFAQAHALAKPDGRPVAELSRPFDRDRRGFVLGEGAGIIILESEEHARSRGANARVELAGWGVTSDAFHMTAPEPAGRGQIRAIANALNVAHLNSDEVAHVNAHATGTSIGDQAEAAAIHSVFGSRAMVAAPKGSIGHLVGAAGAVEAIITARTIEAGVVPHTVNLENPDVGVELDFVMGSPRETPVPAALSNSFGFGGQNVTLLLRRM